MQKFKIIQIIPINESSTEMLRDVVYDDQVILGVALLEDKGGNQHFDWLVSNKYGDPVPYLSAEDRGSYE